MPGPGKPPAVLFSFPKSAAVGRVLPKSKIYEHSKARSQLKNLFVEQVEQIIWQYKLAPETIHLPDQPDVAEIQLFTVVLKVPECSPKVLDCIDRAIPFPIIFELAFDNRVKLIAAYKRLTTSGTESATSRPVLSTYFATDWLPKATRRMPIPVVIHMAQLYAALLQNLLPWPARQKESLSAWVTRVEQAMAKRREIEKTRDRLCKEKQFNRKVQINANLKQLKDEFEKLIH